MKKADYYCFISGGTKSLINSWFPAILDGAIGSGVGVDGSGT